MGNQNIQALIDIIRKKNVYSYDIEVVKTKYKEFMSYIDQINGLILGDSHALCSLIPEKMLYNFYNLALSSQDLYFSYQFLKTYESEIKNLKKVILMVSPYSNHFSLSKTVRGVLTLIWERVFNIETNYNKSFLNLKNVKMSLELKDSYKDSYEPKFVFNMEKGYLDTFHFQDLTRNLQQSVEKFNHIATDYTNDELLYLYKIIELCKKKNIELILVNSPFRSDCLKCYQNIGYSSERELYPFVEKICTENNIKFVYIDSKFLEDDDFRDYHHLNKKGAEKFTDKFNKLISEGISE